MVFVLGLLVVVGGEVELVQPASISVMANVVTTASLRTMLSYTTGARSPVRRVSAGRRAT
jgi:hypothetical protein